MGKNKQHARHKGTPASEMRRRDRDNRFVSFISYAHGWDRQPGDKLTRMQRVHVGGGVLLLAITIAFLAYEAHNFYQIVMEMGQPGNDSR
jgi:hypothetical protein